jgi:two-component system, chemotaxis family, chemotaxis protein CheY
MELENLAEMRVLLVARKNSSTQVLRTVFNIAGITKVTIVDEPRRAIELLCVEHFHAVYVEGALEHDGMPFAQAARRLPSLLNPMIAIFAVFPQARKRDVETARDLGVHDVICRPVSPKTVIKKLRAALVEPRPFIAAPNFFGPDRRAVRASAPPVIKERRQRGTRKVSVAMV